MLTTKASTEEKLGNVTEGSGLSFNCGCDDVAPLENQIVFNFNRKEVIQA